MAAAPVIAASLLGSWATLPNIPDWYTGLAKPWFTPPNWIFGPVWTVLYTIMTIAFFRILRQPEGRNNRLVIAAFMVQIFLNAAWSIGFFGARSPFLGAVIIFPLWISIFFHNGSVLEAGPHFRLNLYSLSHMGQFCSAAEFCNLVEEQLIYSTTPMNGNSLKL